MTNEVMIQKWREDFEQYPFLNGSIRLRADKDEKGFYESAVTELHWCGYLVARKQAQVEIDKYSKLCDDIATSNLELSETIQTLKQELEDAGNRVRELEAHWHNQCNETDEYFKKVEELKQELEELKNWRKIAQGLDGNAKENEKLRELVKRAMPSMTEYSDNYYDCDEQWLKDAKALL